ncbi:unnamed protein product [Allacma fusca]|uniref:Ig-like domain-containing protein n=1 Tax=Allacma fusca TaxID=39272 RepID=A0A8J2PPM4_9HEXA|nr:unnamed protein product [Allacma fusca]
MFVFHFMDSLQQVANSLRLKRSSPESDVNNSNSKTFSIKRLTPQNKPFDKGHRSVTVVAGNTLSIYCNITGANESDITVRWFKDGEDLKQSKLSFDYPEAEAKHRGLYNCSAVYSGKLYDYQFYVRVKDKLMPLWPFLGICLEVAVLCIIIVVYEKRRNKTELEESDTDGSPDQ